MPYLNIRDNIAGEVENVIDVYGRSLDVLKYNPSASANPYKQRARLFLAAVVVTGHIAYDAEPDMISKIGQGKPLEGMITFSKLHLAKKFPGVTFENAITTKDELGFDGHRFRIIATHRTGSLGSDRGEVLIVGFDFIKGRKEEVYP